MAEEWFTYKDLAERLGISSEAVRQKAIRYRWPRRMNNHGKAEVRVDFVEVRDQVDVNSPRKPKNAVEPRSDARPTPAEPPSNTALALAALDAHVSSLKDMLAKAEAMIERERERADDERGRAYQLRVQLDALMEERVSDARRVAEVEAAISELRALMAERAARPWWRQLAG